MSEFRRLPLCGSLLQDLTNESQVHLYQKLSMLKLAHLQTEKEFYPYLQSVMSNYHLCLSSLNELSSHNHQSKGLLSEQWKLYDPKCCPGLPPFFFYLAVRRIITELILQWQQVTYCRYLAHFSPFTLSLTFFFSFFLLKFSLA